MGSSQISVNDSEVKIEVSSQNIQVTAIETPTNIVIGNSGPQGSRGSQILSGGTNPSITVGLIGDQYINTDTGFLFGPKTESGWGSGVLLGSGLKFSDVAYTHYQTSSSTAWIIEHNLQFNPSITVVDLGSKVVEGDYEYNGNTIIARFSQNLAGAAYLS